MIGIQGTCPDCGKPVLSVFKYCERCRTKVQLKLYETVKEEQERHTMSMGEYLESLSNKHEEGNEPKRPEWHKWVYGGSKNPKL